MLEVSQGGATHYQLIGPTEDGKGTDLLATLNDRDSRQRLQALIAEWLGMENLVVLSGAGTSVPLGGRTMEGLESVVLETIRALPEIPGSISAIIDARRTALATKLEERIGFEAWLSYIVNASFIGSAPASVHRGSLERWRKSDACGSLLVR